MNTPVPSAPDHDQAFTLRWLLLPAAVLVAAFAIAALVIAAADTAVVVEPVSAPTESLPPVAAEPSVPAAADALARSSADEPVVPTF